VEIGFGLGGPDLARLRREAAAAEAAGLAFVSVGDNPSNQLETLVALTIAAGSTSRSRVGTSMLDCHGRDPLVVAAALSSVAQLAPGLCAWPANWQMA
jgi:alkanesulfonate monooxygenase SsuD/methylene tetrahydromethanopterin reductase-like flavin-dependent oxidoreductase (luciferase family)